MKSLIQYLLCSLFFLTVGCNKDGEGTPAPSPQDKESSTLFSREATADIVYPNSIYGLWESNVSTDVGYGRKKYHSVTRLEIDLNKITLAVRCAFEEGPNVYVEVSVPAILENDVIIPAKNVKADNVVEGHSCSAKIEKNDVPQVKYTRLADGLLSLSSLIDIGIMRKIGN